MNKGIDINILDLKTEISNIIRNGMNKGIPISVSILILDNMILELTNILNNTLAQTSKEMLTEVDVKQ